MTPGARILDVGCGPGRHSYALAQRGFEVVGVDIADRFITLARAQAPAGATFVRADARDLSFDAEFDAVISLCQGAFGLSDGGPTTTGPAALPLDPDRAVLDGMVRALRPGGRLALTAFSAYFQLRYPTDGGTFDAERGVHHERAEVRDESGAPAIRDLWTTCFTPRELRLLAAAAGLEEVSVWGVEPGAYARAAPGLDHPEFLVAGRRADR